MKRLAFLLLAVFIASPAGARCLAYEPTKVTLDGELVSRTLPGPPGYANIARGDTPEKVLFLKLAKAICVKADPTSSRNASSHAGLEELQLSVGKVKARHRVGQRVRVTGTLSSAQGRRHRTPVVLELATLRGL